MEKKIKEKGLQKKVFLVGSVPNASRFLKAFDVFVLPSRYEGFSITVLETLFADVPMLVTKVGGNREAVAGFDPFLYKLDDTEEFKNKLHNLLNDKDLRARAREVFKKRVLPIW